MKVYKLNSKSGFSLIELLVAIVVIGIILSMAMQSMTIVVDDNRKVTTKREMDRLAQSIVGNPDIANTGVRSDFGFVGDNGSFPSSLQDLYENPGGWTTWDGPYIPSNFTQDSTGFKFDEWSKAYNYSGGITITSTGSGSTITKKIADATSDYIINSFNGLIKDSQDSLPGPIYDDSIDIEISIPNGAGSNFTKTYNPDSVGTFILDSMPVGQHQIEIIYTPDNDTLKRFLTILPRHKSNVTTYNFGSSYFSSAGGGGGGGGSSGVETLRPTGDGNSDDLNDEGCSKNWQCVNETTSDGDGTYVKGEGSNWNMDTYQTANHSTGSGVVDSIIVYVKAKGSGGGKKARTAIRIGGNDFLGSQNNTTASYVDYATTYITNPSTSSAWSWTDIDNLEVGVDLKKEAFCTQVWVEVYYTY